MSKASALDKYTALVEKRNKHIEDNKAVFDDHQKIVMDIIDAENQLRDDVAAEFEVLTENAKTDTTVKPAVEAGVSNGEYNVLVTPQTQTWGDIEVLDALVASGEITKEIRDRVVKTQKRPPRITIQKI